MIQRVQSLYLIAAAVALAASLVVPKPSVEGASWLGTVVMAFALALAVGGGVAIFQYSDRTRQRATVLTLQYGALLLLAGLLALRFLPAGDGPAAGGYIWVVAALPGALGYLFFLLARKSIERDIARVRSMDRLR
jgi:hypothetical protein